MSDKTLEPQMNPCYSGGVNKDNQLTIRFHGLLLERVDAYRLKRGLRRPAAMRELIAKALDLETENGRREA